MGLTTAARVAHWRQLKRVTLLLCCVAVVLAAALAMTLVRKPKPPVPRPLTLPDGSSVRVLMVTYGTNHIVGPPFVRWVARLPVSVQPLLTRLLGKRAQGPVSTTTTATPTMVVWLEWLTNAASASPRSGYFEALLSDSSGFISGESAQLGGWSSPESLRFRVFPRREAVFSLNFFYHGPSGGVQPCGSLPIANPRPGSFPQWRAEALPASKRAGDVEVTLEGLNTGHGSSAYVRLPGGGHALEFSTNRFDARNRTACLLRLRSLTHTNEVWRVAGEEVSDPTGNQANNCSMSWGGANDGYFTFEPGLWLSEAAWKLKCELKRTEGFAPGETFTFQAVPLGAVFTTNRLHWTTNFGGLRVTLAELARRAPRTNQSSSSMDFSHCSFTVSGLTNGQHLDLLSARTDNGTNLEVVSWGGSLGERSYKFDSIPAEAKTADFTFTVQQARWVEFTVKPQTGLTRLEIRPAGKP